MLKKFLFTSILLSLLISVGSAKSNYGMGKSFLKKEKWDSAVFYLKNALKEDPDNPKILRDLGSAYYHQGSFEKSTEYLNKAYSFKPSDGKTILYLGLSYERTEDYEKAKEVYQKYLQLGRKGKAPKRITARLGWLNQLEIKKQIREALEKEKSGVVDTAGAAVNSITVLYFKNLSGSEEWDPLSKGIAELLITDLSKVRRLQVIERLRLQELLDEIGLGETGMVDTSTAPRIGRILRAEKVISGTLNEWGEENLKMDPGMLSVSTNDYDQLKEATGRLNQFFQLEKELAFGIIDRLGITLTKEERDEIKKVPTESMLAFLAYCRGLDCQDRRDYEGAADQFKEARLLDPDFTQAQQKEKQAQDLREGAMGIDEFELVCLSTGAREMGAEGKGDRLQASGRDATGNFIRDDPNAPSVDPSQPTPPIPSEGTVIIKGEIK